MYPLTVGKVGKKSTNVSFWRPPPLNSSGTAATRFGHFFAKCTNVPKCLPIYFLGNCDNVPISDTYQRTHSGKSARHII